MWRRRALKAEETKTLKWESSWPVPGPARRPCGWESSVGGDGEAFPLKRTQGLDHVYPRRPT